MNYEVQKKRNFIALLAAYFAANVIFIMSPAINAMATGMFADKSYTAVLLVSTISSLCMIPGSLVAGPILNKIGFKKLHDMAVKALRGKEVVRGLTDLTLEDVENIFKMCM